MFDHSDLNAPSDYARIINIDEAWERGYWSARLEISETELRTAISTVGDLVVDVRRHFGK